MDGHPCHRESDYAMRLTQRDDSGVASIFVVLCAVLLLGAVGISVDVGRAVAVSRSAQNGADGVALGMAKDCVVRGGLAPAGYDRFIRTSPAIGNGQSQSLVAGSCGSGSVTARATETMDYTFAKVFGMTNTVLSRPATAKWGQLASGVIFPFTFSNCAFPSAFTVGNSVTPGTLMMLYGQGVVDTCTRDGDTSGQSSNSKGFIFNGCTLTSIGGTLTDANGNSFVGTACDGTSLDFFVGKDVLLPVWGSAVANPGGSVYTITTLVGFHVLGWSGNGATRGGAMSARCTSSSGFTGDAATSGDSNKPCLYGYVTSFTSTTGGTTGAPCLGSSDSLQPACFVYLSS
jgi:Flp pilus assembly protein TadG